MEKKETLFSKNEDIATKVAWQYFCDEVMPYLGIKGKVAGMLSTEMIHMELKKMYEDMNFLMEDGSIKHFEFQSTNEGLSGLKRFRVYEALTSYQFRTQVTTYVLYSGNIKNPMTEFTEGMNTYRVRPIIMSDRSADEVIETLQQKVYSKQKIQKAELLPLALCPLMGGNMTQKERIQAVYKITRDACTDREEDLRKVEAVIYIMADKFLDAKDMEKLKEEIRMTRLGQMLYEDGKIEGMREGELKGKLEGIIQTCKEMGILKSDVIKKVMDKFGKNFEEATEEVEKYWNED